LHHKIKSKTGISYVFSKSRDSSFSDSVFFEYVFFFEVHHQKFENKSFKLNSKLEVLLEPHFHILENMSSNHENPEKEPHSNGFHQE
jgi:hypothetical protein